MILQEARRITGADAGTLYMVKNQELSVEIIHNDSMNIYKGGLSGEKTELPPVPLNKEFVSGYTAITGKVVNIPDVYSNESFNFSGPKKYDELTKYHTKSILVVPLQNHSDEVIGVLQLINSLNKEQNIIPFTSRHETVINSMASLAAISITNEQLLEDIKDLFESFVQVMVTAIDNKTPYNASHTENVTNLTLDLAKAVNKHDREPFKTLYFDEASLKQLEMAAWLHDIGKISIPLSVMNKRTRLDEKLPLVISRLQLAKEQQLNKEKTQFISNLQSTEGNNDPVYSDFRLQELSKRCDQIESQYDYYIDLVYKVDNPAFLVDKNTEGNLNQLTTLYYSDQHGNNVPILTSEELKCLTVAKGTLTEEEKGIMQKHVEITEKMLRKIPFTKNLSRIPEFSSKHHELLNGQGYPRGLTEENIPLEARILTIADIFDALTAKDRPYKEGLPVSKALEIMKNMAEQNEIDSQLFNLFQEEHIWKHTIQKYGS